MIVLGLGNPGLKYRFTRHNAGYIFVNHLARQYHKYFYQHKDYRIARIKIYGKKILLIKPQCWMNESGIKVAQIVKEFHQDFLVVLDDINLPLGKIRLRAKGSDGGHKGLASIIATLRTENFPRLRIGIGRPSDGDIVSYVLDKFTPQERRIINRVVKNSIKGLKILLNKNFINAQNYINSINFCSVGQ